MECLLVQPLFALGYAAYIVDKIANIDIERESGTALSTNKFIFKKYVEKCEQVIEAVHMKQKEREKTASAKTAVAVNQVLNKNVPPSVMAKKSLASKSVQPAVRPNVTFRRSRTTTTTRSSNAPPSHFLDCSQWTTESFP